MKPGNYPNGINFGSNGVVPIIILLLAILLLSATTILKGTASTGTAMWNSWIGGVGRVEYTYPFYPYIVVNKPQTKDIDVAVILAEPYRRENTKC